MDCWILSVDHYGESADKLIEKLLELDEEELSNESRAAELLGFYKFECSEDILGMKSKYE